MNNKVLQWRRNKCHERRIPIMNKEVFFRQKKARDPNSKLSLSYISVRFQIFIHWWTNEHSYIIMHFIHLAKFHHLLNIHTLLCISFILQNFIIYLGIHFHFWRWKLVRWTKSIIMHECPFIHLWMSIHSLMNEYLKWTEMYDNESLEFGAENWKKLYFQER